MDSAQWIVIGVGVFIFAVSVSGAWYNRWVAQRVVKWWNDGVKKLGRPGVPRWGNALHSKGQLLMDEVRAPFRKLEIFFVLESRENPAVWIYHHLRGRRDELILRADLRQAPSLECEARPQGTRGLERYLAVVDQPYKLWKDGGKFTIAWRGANDPAALERLRVFLEKYPQDRLRVSLQSASDHLALRIHLTRLLTTPADEFFAGLKGWLR